MNLNISIKYIHTILSTFGLAFFATAVLSSCQSVASTEVLYADYKIRYLSDTRELSVKAKFRTQSEEQFQSFVPENGVRVLDQVMDFKSMQGVTDDFFEYEQRGAFPKDIAFEFSTPQEQPVRQTIDFEPLERVFIAHPTIQRDSGCVLKWQGDIQSATSEIAIIIEVEGQQPLVMNKIGKSKSNEVYIRKEQLATLASGKATIRFVQKYYQTYPSDALVRGSYIVEYYHRSQSVDVL